MEEAGAVLSSEIERLRAGRPRPRPVRSATEGMSFGCGFIRRSLSVSAVLWMSCHNRSMRTKGTGSGPRPIFREMIGQSSSSAPNSGSERAIDEVIG
jgi:hypothetical protein